MMHECLVEEPLGKHLCARRRRRRRRRRGESLTASKLKSNRKRTERWWRTGVEDDRVIGPLLGLRGLERVGIRFCLRVPLCYANGLN
jgi:hypothetical protein